MKAVLFDLYETLVTGYNPDRRREQRGARLGLAEDYFDREWGARHDQRMRGEFPDYHSVIRDICEAAKVKPNEDVIEELYQDRLPLRLASPVLACRQRVKRYVKSTIRGNHNDRTESPRPLTRPEHG